MAERSYFIRYTPSNEGFHTLGTISFVFDELDVPKYVIGKEQASSEHFHIAIWGVRRSAEDLRYQIKKRLDGQVYISGKEIQDKLKAIAYCFKDGNYTYKGIDANEFFQGIHLSKRKVKFDDLLQEAEKKYDGKDDKSFLKELLEAHVQSNKKIYLPHIRAQLLLSKLKKDTYRTHRDYIIEKILDNM